MHNKKSSIAKKSLIATFVATTLSIGVAIADNVDFKLIPQEQGTTLTQVTDQVKHKQEQKEITSYIIELEDQAVALYQGGIPGLVSTQSFDRTGRLDFRSSQAQSYQSYLKEKQQGFVNTLQSQYRSLSVEKTLQLTMNAVIVSFPGKVDLYEQLQRTPGVKQVYKNEVLHAQLDSSIDLIQAPAVWELLGERDTAGQGVKVAIIDSGIIPDHPMFAAQGHVRPEGLPTDDYCSTVDETFCNDKLVVARVYGPPSNLHPNEYDSPKDYNGHGTHVASTAAGNAVTVDIEGTELGISGVAPGASIMAYKALMQTTAGTASGMTTSLIAALEDAVDDGADVINNSWGGGYGGSPDSSPYKAIFEAAEAAGVVVVTAAGNGGPGSKTIGCPACVESGITVANTQTGRIFSDYVIAGPGYEVVAIQSNAPWPTDSEGKQIPLSAEFNFSATLDPDNFEGCNAFEEGLFEDQIAVIPRGECAFSDKINNAAAAGAVGVIISNNTPGIIRMDAPGTNIPAVSVTFEHGEELYNNWNEGDEITISLETRSFVDSSLQDIMNDQSSRGPNGNPSFLKPDLSAPGTDILAAYPGAQSPFATLSGTSMASPHVAGAAALLRHFNPDLTPAQVKSVLMSSSDNTVIYDYDAETKVGPFERGAGRINLAKAVNSALTFDTPSFASAACIVSCTFDRTVTAIGEQNGEWHGTVSFLTPGAIGSVGEQALEFDEEGNATFTLDIDVRYAGDGWAFGEVVWQDASGQFADARLPIAVHAELNTNTDVLSATAVDSANLDTSNPVAINTVFKNPLTTEPITLTVEVPQNFTLVDGTFAKTIKTSDGASVTEHAFEVSEDNKRFVWKGALDVPKPILALESADDFDYAGLSISQVLGLTGLCASNGISDCDWIQGTSTLTPFGGFYYDGKLVNVVTFTDDGMISVGGPAFDATYDNTFLPDSEAPNGVLAPFWTDLSLGQGAGYDHGDIYTAVFNDGSDQWYAIEWKGAVEWFDAYLGVPNPAQYSFSIWIKLGTDEIYFNYFDMPNYDGQTATVGVEDVNGEIGYTHYFNGDSAASYPRSGQAFKVISAQAGEGAVAINYEATPNHVGVAQDVSQSITEGESFEIDLSEHFTFGDIISSTYSLANTEDGDFASAQVFTVAVSGEGKLDIIDGPASGTLEFAVTDDDNEEEEDEANAQDENDDEEEVVNPYLVTYTPKAGFSGTDSFSYQIVDDNGATTTTGTVSVQVQALPVEQEEPKKKKKKWYKGNFGIFTIFLALSAAIIRRRTLS